MRTATITRNTAETQIELTLNLDGSGKSEINSGCGFLDHMLTLFAKHGRFDLAVSCIAVFRFIYAACFRTSKAIFGVG